jgi:hypothetical protein
VGILALKVLKANLGPKAHRDYRGLLGLPVLKARRALRVIQDLKGRKVLKGYPEKILMELLRVAISPALILTLKLQPMS